MWSLLVVVATVAVVGFPVASCAKLDNFAVFGYLPEYRLNGFDYEAAFQTGLTHLIFFSIEIDRDGLPTALDRLPSKEQAKQARVAADKVGGKVLLGLGGNSRSNNFGLVATNPGVQAKFLKALDKLLLEYQFDGVDYNWEYPANHAEWNHWNSLNAESKRVLLGGGSKAIITFTIYNDENHYDIVQRYRLLDHADYVHSMVYDQPHHHSTFAFSALAIRWAREKKLDLKKFTLGVPFYARHVSTGEPKTYAELQPMLHNDVDDQVGHYYFNSRSMIAKKVAQAYAARLGGIMIWELGQDVQPLSRADSLMSSLDSVLGKYQVSANEVRKHEEEYEKVRTEALRQMQEEHQKKKDGEGNAVLGDHQDL